MATTFATFRDEQAALISALAPVSFADVPFREHRDERDLRAWAREFPSACFRRFSIHDLFEYDPPATSTYDQEWVTGRCELVVAYPADFRYGQQNRRDQSDVVREDEKYLDEKVGLEATGSYTEGWCVRQSTEHAKDAGVSFLVMTYGFQFYRSR